LPDDLSLVARLWQEIETRLGGAGLTCSWAWTESWLRHYGDLVPHRFVLGELDGPCAIAVLAGGVSKSRGPFPIRTLHLGTAGEPDAETVRVQYNRVLVGDAHREHFLRGIAKLAPRIDLKWEEFHLDGFSEDEILPLLAHDRAFEADPRVCYIADLNAIRADGGTVLGSIRKEPAKKIRRSMRRLEETYGPIQLEWSAGIDEARAIFEEMRDLHQQRWEAVGEPGKFGSDRFDGFHRELVERLFANGNILLARVRAGDQTLGCDYSLIDGDRILAYQWGIAQLEDKRLSPGLVTAAVVMQEALERGYGAYDWLSGDVFYKKQLSTTEGELIWAIAARGARIRVINKLAEGKRLAQRLTTSRAQVTEADS
jgi:CelD/BcsL family acetyltransferase involved in cellulose biosynthesis